MHLLKFIWCLLLPVFLAGCASGTGVLQMGPDTYTLSVGVAGTGTISGNDMMAKRQAFTEANAYCASQGKQILVKNIGRSSTMYGSTSDIIFQCLGANDPALRTRPEYSKEPDVVIENRK